ncbi:Z1 domain-containing protein [Pantoea sp. PNT03]|jgi:hypothetical protein|uniref:Z1 domain-containing protein n=1 Tax=Pantoea sp. PNT03 TaxID=2769258 RepID=UPI00177D8B90|nr:Z1 domain-containing protein [Pantoea sp. PNT03]MBD9660764.1 hypothetical protein [Pantoea sp. PNT03]
MEFFSYLEENKGYDADLKLCIFNIVKQLEDIKTSRSNPGVLLGKIQSGKTRGFLGVIARAFDVGYDIALVLTKGTKTLAKQTVSRINHDFSNFIEDDYISIYDIMELPEKLHKPELKRKIIIVAKKESNNLDRVIDFFENLEYPDLKNKKVLLIDDEADLASIRFVKKNKKSDNNETVQGKIAEKMDFLRDLVDSMRFLQVTATPYSLYLQPESYSNPFKFLPKKPAFTELLPIHDRYVGGDDYFGDFTNNDPRKGLYIEVPADEIEYLRHKEDVNLLDQDVIENKGLDSLKKAVSSFLIAVVIRRWQQKQESVKQKKYAMIIHNDTQRKSHNKQWEIVDSIRQSLEVMVKANNRLLRSLFDNYFTDIQKTVHDNNDPCPSQDDAFILFSRLISDGEINVQKVNSDVELASILDPTTAELKLRTEANIFIGGSLLDRGITIPNLLAFYYGRNPKNMQADTVLQHSRMYGARDRSDLSVTRFYTSLAVFNRLKHIHQFDSALRRAFLNKDSDSGVIFIQSDASKGVVPCSPTKVSVSRVMTLNSGGYYLPSGFDLSTISNLESTLRKISELIMPLHSNNLSLDVMVDKCHVIEIIKLIKKTLQLSQNEDFYWDAMIGLIDYYCKAQGNDETHVIVELNRKITKEKSGDKSGKSIVGGRTIRELLAQKRDLPAIVFLKQDGTKANGWNSDTYFWWPVLIAPTNSDPCVYSLP